VRVIILGNDKKYKDGSRGGNAPFLMDFYIKNAKIAVLRGVTI